MTYEYDFVSAVDAKTFQSDVQSRSEDQDGPWEIVNLGVEILPGAKKSDPAGGSEAQEQAGILYWMFTRRTRKPSSAKPSTAKPSSAKPSSAKPSSPKVTKAVEEAVEELAIEMWRMAVEDEPDFDGETYADQDFYDLQTDGEEERWRALAAKVLRGDE